ncbi:DUF4844 domain-containing protein [Paucibacter sp. DJ1R-11]|uniref:DUF4844 domain-containing protein n=1 Tax=Paucibacter sp. DJ1R-11 TaxID=2893556 RepID=UPI0021E4CC94|nr:DUF4844 domain-containing protein [Paucibacter sp. DJ1R-11]MCV2362482.1 DUF4844 domain-containing protein [Paucibacter sp. DJ1R-11]
MSRRRFFLSTILLAAAGISYAVLGPHLRPELRLQVDEGRLGQLKALRAKPKFLDLPGAPAAEERRRLEPLINELLDRLIAGLQANPSDAWVIKQMEPTVEAFHLEDTEARERCLGYIEAVFKIFAIPDDRGAFRKFLIFW